MLLHCLLALNVTVEKSEASLTFSAERILSLTLMLSSFSRVWLGIEHFMSVNLRILFFPYQGNFLVSLSTFPVPFVRLSPLGHQILMC